jgi:MoxR-like ATPase
MEERQVTVAGRSHALPRLLFVVATQRPEQQEGTSFEAQLDHFLMHVLVSYPEEAAEARIIRLARSEENDALGQSREGETGEPPIPQEVILEARAEVRALHVAEAVEKYIVDLVFATRYPERYEGEVRERIQVGAGPRGALALDRCSRAHAWLAGRDFVTPDDARAVVHDCLRHRLELSHEALVDGVTPDSVITELVKRVAVA